MQRCTIAFAAAAAAALASTAHALDPVDIIIRLENSRVVTGLGVPSQGTFFERRVHQVNLGAQGIPNFASNPGYDCEIGTFPASSTVSFNLRSRLWFWNGTTFVPTTGETMQFSSGATSVMSGAGPVNGFALSVASNGTWHRHINMTLFPTSGADPGAYMIEMELVPSAPGLLPSRPYYLVFRQNATQQTADAAIAFVNTRILPPALAGDATGDGAVNFLDLNAVLAGIGQVGQWLPGDVNRDGAVNFLDLNAVLANFGS